MLDDVLALLISDLLDLVEELLALLLLDLELAKLNVEFKDVPCLLGLQLWEQLILSDLGDVRNIALLSADQDEALLDLVLDLFDFGGETLFFALLESVEDDVENPLSLSFKFLVSWVESVGKFDLKPLRDVLFDNLLVLDGSEDVVDFLSDELILEVLTNLLLLLVVRCCGLVSLVNKVLLLDLCLVLFIFLLDVLALSDVLVSLDRFLHNLVLVRFQDGLVRLLELTFMLSILLDEIQILVVQDSVFLGVLVRSASLGMFLLEFSFLPFLGLDLFLEDLVIVGNEVVILTVKLVIVIFVIFQIFNLVRVFHSVLSFLSISF